MAEGSGWQNLLASASSAGASLGWRIGGLGCWEVVGSKASPGLLGFDSDFLPEPVGIAG